MSSCFPWRTTFYEMCYFFMQGSIRDFLAPRRCLKYCASSRSTRSRSNRWSLFSHMVSVGPSQKRATKARKTKFAIQRVPSLKIMSTYWLWPGGSSCWLVFFFWFVLKCKYSICFEPKLPRKWIHFRNIL